MSRPPIDRAAGSPRGTDTSLGRSPYFGLRFADLVALAEALARNPEGVTIPGTASTLAPGIIEIPGKDRGLARTLVEIPALFAHILGEHQSHYAAEAYIGTASQPDSLVRHGRRLAYVPDQGVAATGLAVFEVKDGLNGNVPLHFALQSEPKGAVKSQTYESLEPLYVEAEWNAILPGQARVPTRISFIGNQVDIPLFAPSGLAVGDVTLLQGQGKRAVCEVVNSTPDSLRLRRLSSDAGSSGVWPPFSQFEPYVLLAQPDTETRVFGHDADPLAFPPGDIANPAVYVTPDSSTERSGYTVTGLSTGSYTAGQSLILSESIDTVEKNAPVALVQANTARALEATLTREGAVSFRRGHLMAIPQPDPVPADFPANQLVERSVSARVSLLDLVDTEGTEVEWPAFPLDGVVYSGWTQQIDIVPNQPNPASLTSTLTLAADLSEMRPGRSVIVERLSDGFAAAATITRLEAQSPDWQVSLSFEPGAVASAFRLGDVRIHANVVPVSHGETKTEILGGSDGVSPHQAFELKNPDVTRIAGATGSSIELTVRVNGVLWDLVPDFHGATPEARIARTQADANHKMTVVFGGETRGAVPPSGSRNITASYRTGLGRVGDAEPGRLGRIRKASPILNSVTNLLPLSGGTDPASLEDMRRQATRPILTFDRAVSLRDHADLALLFPGITQASARWLDRGAIELIAADANGQPPADTKALRAFLDTRRDDGIPLVILTPQPINISLALRVERERSWLADAVRLAVTEALLSNDKTAPGLFTFAARAFSAPQSLSGLYANLLELEGVTGIEATRFDISPGSAVSDIVHATDRQWLRLLPNDLIVDVIEPGALIPGLERGNA